MAELSTNARKKLPKELAVVVQEGSAQHPGSIVGAAITAIP